MMTRLNCRRRPAAGRIGAFVGASALALTALTGPAAAQAEAPRSVEITAQPLDRALVALGRQFNLIVVIPEEAAAGRTSPSLAGVYAPEEAFARLLEGSGLEARRSASGAMVIAASAAQENAAAPETGYAVEDEIVVTGAREYLYRTQTTSTLGPAIPLAELPATVNVITGDFLEDTLAYDFEDIAAYVPGVINGGFSGGTNATVVVRGFSNSAIFFNGMRQFRQLQQTPSLDTIDRVEIVKGPSGADFGVADAGGTVLFVTKKPQREFGGEVFAAIGDFGFRWLRGDVTGPITENGDLRYRLITAYSERAEWRDGRPDQTPRWTVAPSLAWDYMPGGNLTFEYQHTFSNEPLDRGIFYLEGAGFEDNDNFAPRTFSIQSEQDEQEIHSDRFELALNQQLGPVFSVQLQAQRQQEDIENLQLNFASIRNVFADDGLTWDGVTREVGYGSLRDRLTETTVDNLSGVLRADFALGAVENTVRVGYQYSDGEFEVDYNIAGGDGRLRISNTLNIFEPDNNPDLVFTGRDTAVFFSDEQEVQSVFGQWSADIAGRARLIAGVRYDDAEFVRRFDSTAGPGTPTENTSSEVSYRIAGSYDITPFMTAFAGYSDSWTPQGGVTRDLQAIDPLHNVSYEVGLKTELFNGAALWTNTIYQITRDNIAAADPDDPTDEFSIPFGEVRIRGFESEIAGSVNDDLDLTAGLTLQESENIRTENPADLGNEFAGVPNFQASVFGNYRLTQLGLPRLSGRIGVIHVGEREGNGLNNFQLPAYTRVDLGARFALFETTEIDIFVENLFDEFYIEQTQGRAIPEIGLIPGNRRLVQFSIRHSF